MRRIVRGTKGQGDDATCFWIEIRRENPKARLFTPRSGRGRSPSGALVAFDGYRQRATPTARGMRPIPDRICVTHSFELEILIDGSHSQTHFIREPRTLIVYPYLHSARHPHFRSRVV